MSAPRVSVVIATWNAGDVLGRCLDSVLAQEVPRGFEVIVVDNASTDGTRELLRSYGDRVGVIASEQNLRYAGGNNLAAKRARGEILFFLNSDTELLGPDVVARLVHALESADVGIAGPKLLNPDGTLQPSCAAHPSVTRAALLALGAQRLLPVRLTAHLAPERWSHDGPLDTGWVTGAALAIRAADFARVGGFWETMYGEEQDLAFRVQQLGMSVRFVPAAHVMHVGNHSLRKRWSGTGRAERVATAELAFLHAHYRPRPARVIRALTLAGYAWRAVAHRLLGHSEQAAAFKAMVSVYRRAA